MHLPLQMANTMLLDYTILPTITWNGETTKGGQVSEEMIKTLKTKLHFFHRRKETWGWNDHPTHSADSVSCSLHSHVHVGLSGHHRCTPTPGFQLSQCSSKVADHTIHRAPFNHLRSFRTIRLSQPHVNNAMLIGCMVCFSCIFLQGLDGAHIPEESFATLCHVRAPYAAHELHM
jgi:hypothetical protein